MGGFLGKNFEPNLIRVVVNFLENIIYLFIFFRLFSTSFSLSKMSNISHFSKSAKITKYFSRDYFRLENFLFILARNLEHPLFFWLAEIQYFSSAFHPDGTSGSNQRGSTNQRPAPYSWLLKFLDFRKPWLIDVFQNAFLTYLLNIYVLNQTYSFSQGSIIKIINY